MNRKFPNSIYFESHELMSKVGSLRGSRIKLQSVLFPATKQISLMLQENGASCISQHKSYVHAGSKWTNSGIG